MVKKLLFLFTLIFLFLFAPVEVVGQECPTSVGVTANPGTTICAGESITFTANPTGGSGYKYQWQINQLNVNNQTSSTFTTSSLTNGQKVRVIVTTSEENNGCAINSSEVPITVNPVRTVTATIATNNSDICPGETVNFTISAQNNIGSGSSYEWRVNGTSQGTSNTFSSSSLKANDKVQLWVDSAVPCTEPVLSNIIEISEKAGKPASPETINGETTVCSGATGLVYQINSITSATSYEWQLPSGWSGNSTTNSITVTSGNTGDVLIKVRAKNECGDSEFQTLNVMVRDATPPQPGTITGPLAVCPGVSADYSLAAVARATEYVWTLPDGTQQVTTAPNITVTTNTTGSSSNVFVQARNTCGTSTIRNLSVSLKPGKPATPAAISGIATVCPEISQTYSIAAVTGATSYVWTLPSGWSGESTSRSITVTTGTTGGAISVIAKNDCDESEARELEVTVGAGTPAVPVFASPITDICPGVAETFTVNEVAGATGYIWTLPSGWSGTSTTNNISITSANSGTGSISVQATNVCGTSAKKTIQVAIKPPTPTLNAAIEGPSNVCASTTEIIFTIPDVQYATEYVWSAPGWIITNGQGSRTITVTSGTGAGTISVKAKNGCGESVASTKIVTVTSGVPSQPDAITSSLDSNPNICPPKSGVTFTVPAVNGATGYEWSLPAGWEIASGINTRSINVNITANAAYQNEVVSVRARNDCGLSEKRSYTDITVSNFIITDLGADQSVCRSKAQLSIPVELYFGGSNKLKPTWFSNGDGTFSNIPPIGGGNSSNDLQRFFTINYIPGANDITKEYITITMTVPPPQGSSPCGTGKDEMRIYFRNNPTASIATTAPICTGTSTPLTIIGTPNSKVTYSKGTQTGLTVDIGSSGTATIESGTLTANITFTLTGITNLDSPSCSNSNLSSSATVLVTQKPTAEISYAGPFCKSLSTAQIPTLSGTNLYTGGTYSATGDLATKILATTGAFTPSNVAAGTYTVTYTTPAAGGCEAVIATTEVTVTPLPTATIAYANSPFCSSDTADKLVALSGTNAYTGGTYSSTTGLNINASTGVIKAASSTPGDYMVTYSLPAASGCDIVTATTQITITEIPVPVISYTQEAVCIEDSNTYSATITGTGVATGGTFSAPSGLGITSAGVITPSTSTPGTYKVIYILAPANGCGEITAETEITVTPVPSVDIRYAGPFCESTTGTQNVTFTNGIGAYEYGTFEASPSGLTINATTGAITPSSSEAKEYIVTYTIPARGGCSTKIAETTVNITAVPGATLSYPATSFCNGDMNSYNVSYSNTKGNFDSGIFSGTDGLIIDASNGAITPNGSTPGTHTVTYTIPTAEGCESVTTTVNIEIVKPIEINSQPFNVGKCAGETARLEVVANGKDLTYQWFQNGYEVPGATSSILEYSPVDPDDAGDYYVEITGSAPCSFVNSEIASLIVDQNIEVTSTPEAKEFCVGDTTTFSVVASANGGAVEYQWMRDGDELEGEINSSLVLENISLEDEGEYSVFLKGPEGFTCSTITYTAGSLDVFEKPVPNAGNNITACYSEGAIAITDGATVEHASSISWTSDGTGTIDRGNEITGATYKPGETESGIITLTLTAYGNSTCDPVEVQKILTIERLPIITSFSYSTTEFCETDSELKEPTVEGINAFQHGTFTVNPTTGLSISADGKIDPSASEPGTYGIIYSTPTGTYCGSVESDAVTVVIGLEPIAEFFYDGNIFCRDTRVASENTNPVLTLTEARGENFDSFNVVDEIGTVISNSGLSLDADTGAINLSNSAAGDYIVQRTLNYTGDKEDGCIEVTADFTLSITDKPIADFTYPAANYCSNPAAPVAIEPTMDAGALKGKWTSTATPEGANLVLDSTTGVINVTTSEAGTFIITNTVDTEGDGCDVVTDTFTININKRSDATFAYLSPSYCITTEFAAVVEGYETGGVFNSSTLGSRINPSTGAITWNYTDDIDGIHNITYTIAGKGVCEDVEYTTSITIDPLPEGGELSFGSIGRIFVICEDAESGYAVPLNLSNQLGNILGWKYRQSSATSWSTVMADGENFIGTTLSAAQIESLNISETTIFRVEIESGACSLNQFSDTAFITVIPSDIKPTPVQVNPEVVCIGDPVTLTSGTGYESGSEVTGGAFDNSSITNKDWRITDENGNSNYNFNSSANNTRPEKWLRINPHPIYIADINNPSTGRETRFDSNIGDEGNKGFAIVSGDNPSTLETPVFTLDAIDQAILTFDQAYNLTAGDTIEVEISTNGGASYYSVPLYELWGPITSGNYHQFGSVNDPKHKISIDLGNYMGQGNLRLRFNFKGTRAGAVWAVDNIGLPDAPRNVEMEWRDYTDPVNFPDGEYIGDSSSEQWTPKKIGLNTFVVKTRLLFNSNGDACEVAENAETVDVFVFDKYTTSVTAAYGSCGVFEAQLNAIVLNGRNEPVTTYPTPDGYVGRWNVDGNATLVDSDPTDGIAAVNDPNAMLSTSATGTYTVSWILEPTEVDENGNLYADPEACPPVVNELEVVINGCTALDFDGVNDRILIEDPYAGVVSVEAWIRPERDGGTIISGPNFKITTPADVTANSRWYHIAVTNGKLYVDGIEKRALALGSGAGSQTTIGAEIINGEATNFFSGWIEEVRLWKTALTVEQIQFMMNQRLIANGAQMGEQIPMDVPDGLTYADLAGYYRLISAEPEPLVTSPVVYLNEDKPANGLTPDRALNKVPGRLINMETNQNNTAPLPYYSANDGVWGTDATWLRPDVWDPPHTGSIIWNIVQTSHDIQSGNRDITVLGLLSNTGELTIANTGDQNENNSGQFLNISHYLLLNGNIDLVGESQLIQGSGSILAESSVGWLERDQQGTRSSFNYNYWSSPVSAQGSINNADYTIAQVLRDGTTSANPQIINFQRPHEAADRARTTPVTVSEYWLFKFNGTSDVYEEWMHLGSTGTLKTGEGFTMKGTDGNAPIAERQNYIFKGKPHNGDFKRAVGMGKNYLIGNPYPSSIDAREFILDNLDSDVVTGAQNTQNVFNGVVYFWDHFAGHTHILREYVGGYAAFTLAGGVPAISIDERINANEEWGTKIPQQYIPVGQGFFINTGLEITPDGPAGTGINVDGGDIVFKNSQREGVRESNENSIFLKPIYPSKTSKAARDERAKIRLRFDSPKGYHRQILVAADPITTDNVDLGYDAPLIEYNLDDMYWIINQREYVIQAVADFGPERILPLGVQLEEKGSFTIAIDSRENMDDDYKIYLQDKLRDSIHDFKDGAYIEESESGFIDDRFSIVFHKKQPPVVPVPGEGEDKEEEPYDVVHIDYNHETRELMVYNPDLIGVNDIILFDLTGKVVQQFNDIPVAKEVPLLVRQFPTAVYIVKMISEEGTTNKKIIIK